MSEHIAEVISVLILIFLDIVVGRLLFNYLQYGSPFGKQDAEEAKRKHLEDQARRK